jgi:hypothetical protein
MMTEKAPTITRDTLPQTAPHHAEKDGLPTHRPRTLWRVDRFAEKALSEALSTVIGAYTGATESQKTLIWNAFLDFPTAKLCVHGTMAKTRKQLIRNLRNNQQGIEDLDVTPPPRGAVSDRTMRVAIAKIQAGFPGGAARVLLQEDTGSANEVDPPALMAILQELHPPEPQANRPACPNAGKFVVTQSSFLEVAQRMARARSPGLSGWTEDLLLQAAKHSSRVAAALGAMTADIINNEVPSDVRLRLIACRLIGIPKANGKIRPIGVAEAITKLASSLVCGAVTKAADARFGELQHGVKEGGCENIIHSVRHCVEHGGSVVAIDAVNAFNTISRASIAATLSKWPEMQPIVQFWNFAYGTPSTCRVFHRDGHSDVVSQRGTRQGDPSAGLLFCIAVQKALETAQRAVPTVSVRAYMDDVSIFGQNGADICTATEILVKELAVVGLSVNRSKSEVLQARTGQHLDIAERLGFARAADGIRILGAAIERPQAVEAESWKFTHEFLDGRLNQYRSFFERITQLPSPLRFSLLRACGPARWVFITRTHPPPAAMTHHGLFDDLVLKEVCNVMNVPRSALTAEATKLIALPRGKGGLGIMAFSPIAALCFQASQNPSGDCQRATLAKHFSQVVEGLSAEAKRRCQSTGQGAAKMWLDPNDGRHGAAFSLAVQHRIGVKAPLTSGPFTCPGCTASISPLDTDAHALGCVICQAPGPASRHHAIVKTLVRELSKAGLDAEAEVFVPGLSSVPRDSRMDVVIDDTRPLWLDVTCLSVEAPRWKTKSPASAAQTAEKHKNDKYAELAATRGATFAPVVFDVHGAPSTKTLAVLRKLAHEADLEPAELLKSVEIALHRANGEILCRHRRYLRNHFSKVE